MFVCPRVCDVCGLGCSSEDREEVSDSFSRVRGGRCCLPSALECHGRTLSHDTFHKGREGILPIFEPLQGEHNAVLVEKNSVLQLKVRVLLPGNRSDFSLSSQDSRIVYMRQGSKSLTGMARASLILGRKLQGSSYLAASFCVLS